MKKFALLVATIMAISTFATANTDDTRYGYLGLAYSYMQGTDKADGLGSIDIDGNAVTFIAGATADEYWAAEFRYTTTVGDLSADYSDGTSEDIDGDVSNIAFYVKPMYKIENLELYGLLGYGRVTLDNGDEDESESGFQWGLGANYTIDNDMKIFFDYTKLYDDSGAFGNPGFVNTEIELFTFGLIHKF